MATSADSTVTCQKCGVQVTVHVPSDGTTRWMKIDVEEAAACNFPPAETCSELEVQVAEKDLWLGEDNIT